MICADLANRTKHSALTRKNRTGAKHIRTNVTVKLKPLRLHLTLPNKSNGSNKHVSESAGETASEYRYIIVDKNKTGYDALNLAKGIVRNWEEIIRNM
jgi:hypothetical protein